MKRVARSAIVPRPAQALYALVERIEDYPGFLPWCTGAIVHERSVGRTVATIDVGMAGVKQSFTTENLNQAGESIDVRLVRGPFRHFMARWTFTPLGEAASRIEFVMEYEFSGVLIARLLEPVFRKIADTMVDAFTRRAQHDASPSR